MKGHDLRKDRFVASGDDATSAVVRSRLYFDSLTDLSNLVEDMPVPVVRGVMSGKSL